MFGLKRYVVKIASTSVRSLTSNSSSSSKQSVWRERYVKSLEFLKAESKDPTFYVLQAFLFIGVVGSMMPNELYLRYCASISSLGCILMQSSLFHKVKLAANAPIMFWDGFRFIFHSQNIARIWHENAELRLDAHHEKVYNEHFCELGLKPRQFLTLLQNAKIKTYDEGTVLFNEDTKYNENNAKLYLLLDGEIKIIRGTQFVATMTSFDPLCFLGENVCIDLYEKCALTKKMMQARSIPTSSNIRSLMETNDGDNHNDQKEVFTKTIGHCIIPKGKTITVMEWDAVSLVE